MIKALIVEDDPIHVYSLKELLEVSKVPVEVISICTNVADAYGAICKHKPELIFLDIDLEGGDSGFDLLKRFDVPEFSVIFTTQHNNASNAINALRACALDFLPKPLLASELEGALGRYNRRDGIEQTRTLKQNIESPNEQINAIWISGTEGKTKIEIVNIIYCESNNSSTTFFLANPVNGRQQYVSSVSIKNWERSLSPSGFCRIHNEYLANLKYVAKYSSRLNGGAILRLRNDKELPVSKGCKKDVKARLNV